MSGESGSGGQATGGPGSGVEIQSLSTKGNGNNTLLSPSADSAAPGVISSSTSHFDQSHSSFANLMENTCGLKIPPNAQMLFLVYVSRALPLIAAFGAVIFIIVLLATPENWETNSDATDSEVLDRESNRGVFVSVLIAILMNLIGALMFFIRVKESLVVTNYGFILGPVIGYLLDQSIGTDSGFRRFMTWDGVSYTFESLVGGNFMRYIVTVFLDLFISNPLQDVMKQQVKKKGVIKFLKDHNDHWGKKKHPLVIKYDAFVVQNYPSILQSIVAFVTFNAYTNQTRFAWAYASSTLDRDLRIPPGTIMLCAAIAAILYLNFYTIMDYISERQYFDVNTKLGYAIFILLLLYGLNTTNSMEAPVDGEEDENYTEWLGDAKPVVGVLIFSIFVSYGFVYPLYTRLGCFGRWKPKSFHDHFGDDTSKEAASVQEVRHKVSDDVLDKVEAILKMATKNNPNYGEIDISEARRVYEEEQKLLRKKRKGRKR